jgi:hypothetical protein
MNHEARRGHVPRRSELKNSKDGIFQHSLNWIPAFAGTTKVDLLQGFPEYRAGGA